jgi:hypothetical protein
MTSLSVCSASQPGIAILFLLTTGWAAGCLGARPPTPVVTASPDLAERAATTLEATLADTRGWERIHAAEALSALGDEAGLVRTKFLAEAAAAPDPRIGVWRVLASTTVDPTDRRQWVDLIEAIAASPEAPDRWQAIESLGKLSHAADPSLRESLRTLAQQAEPNQALLVWWALDAAGERDARSHILEALTSVDPAVRRRAAYILRWIGMGDPQAATAVSDALSHEPRGTPAEWYLLTTSLRLQPADSAERQRRVEVVAQQATPAARLEACQALMHFLKPEDLVRFVPLLDAPEADVRIGGAWLISHVLNRATRTD